MSVFWFPLGTDKKKNHFTDQHTVPLSFACIGIYQTVCPTILPQFHPFITSNSSFCQNIITVALASVAQWVVHHSKNLKVTGWIPSQDTCLGCRPGPWLEVCERQPINISLSHQCFSPSLSLSLSLPLKINK